MNRFLLLAILLLSLVPLHGQSLHTQVQKYLKRNKLPHYYHGDSIGPNSKNGYFKTSKDGKTTLTLPKGAINMAVPTGDSAVYFKIVSPKLSGRFGGIMKITEYRAGKIVYEETFGIGEINASVGVRADGAIDNEDAPTLCLYMLSGQIMNYRLQKADDCMIDVFQLDKGREKIESGKFYHSWLLYENDRMGENKDELEKWFEQSDERQLMDEVSPQLEHYYVISYKLVTI